MSCAVTVQLICVFVFAYAKSRFSHGVAHNEVMLSRAHQVIRVPITGTSPYKMYPKFDTNGGNLVDIKMMGDFF